MTKNLQIPATSFATRRASFGARGSGRYDFPVHRNHPHHRMSTPWGKALRIRATLRSATHVAADGFLPLYHRMDKYKLENELLTLAHKGYQIALIAHGSDVRDPDEHMNRYAFSYYSTAPEDWVGRMRRRARQNRAIAASLGVPTFVSTPDLLLDIPSATWLPLCIDPTLWSTSRPALESNIPTVLHLPSQRDPPIKGTELIDPILRQLAASKRIEYRSPDSVMNRAMPDLVRQADIVVEQTITGSYGVAAVEAMAAARLVVGFVGDQTRELMPAVPPIVDGPPTCFGAVMEDVLSNRERFAVQAADGPAFVREWHDGAASAAALRRFLE